MAGWSTLTSGVVGIGVGEAGAAAIEPVLEPLRQDAWAKSKANLLALGTLAQLVAQGLIEHDTLLDDVHRLGFTEARFDAEIQLALVAAPVAELLELWRRGLLGDPQSEHAQSLVDHGLAKAQIEPQYWAAIKELFNARLAPPTVALAVQRGVMRNAKNPATGEPLLPVGPTTEVGVVEPMPVSPLSPLEEARAWGYDFDRLAVEARNAGLSPAPGELLSLLNRGVILEPDYFRGISEGDTRNEWAKALLALRYRLLSGVEASELVIRNWLTPDAGAELAAKDGWTPERFDLLVKLRGRPLAVHQVTTGLARGGAYPGLYKNVPEPYRDAIAQSNIREPFSELAYANRYSLPSAFVFRALLQSGALTASQGETYFNHLGWPPELAKQVADHYGQAVVAKADPHVVKAENQLWTALHKSYVNGESDAATVAPDFTALGIPADTHATVIDLWDREAALVRRQLTPAQIKRAFTHSAVNEATGVPWTRDEALAALVALGYAPLAAGDYLNL